MAGLFLSMKTSQQYEAEIISLLAMNLKLEAELTKALEAIAQIHAEKIITAHDLSLPCPD